MSTIRIQPHKTLTPRAWNVGDWETIINDKVESSKGYIGEFDYSLAFGVGYAVKVNIEQLEAIASVHSVCAWALADCAAGGVRLSACEHLSPDGEARVEISIPAGIVAGELEVTRGLAYMPHAKSSESTAMDRFKLGSRLLEDAAQKIRLEGGWSRFPVEAGSFSELGYEDAAWTVRVSFEEPDDPFLGSVRLMVNRDHPAGRAVIDPDDSDVAELSLSALRTDIFRQLFLQLATDGRFTEQRSFEAESVGAVVAGMAENTLKNDLPTILGYAKNSPEILDRIIQDRTAYLGGD